MNEKIKNFYYVLGTFKKRYFYSILIYASSSVFDIIVLSLLPLLISSLLGNDLNINFINFKLPLNEREGILIIGCLILILTLKKGLFNYFAIFNSIRLSSEIQKKNRQKTFSFYKNVYINEISKNKLEKYLNFTAYIVGVFSENIVFKSITVISEIIIIFIICIYLAFVNIFALLGLISFFLLLLIGYFFLIKGIIYKAGVKQANAMQKLAEIINSVFKGFKEIKVLKLDQYFDRKFDEHNQDYNTNFISYQKLIFLPKYLMEIVMVTFIILLFFSISYFTNNPLSNYFELIGIYLFASFRMTPLAYNIFSSLSQIFSSWYAVNELSTEFKKIDIKQNKNKNFSNHFKNISINKTSNISLKNISFRYENDGRYILNNLNLDINNGTCIGIKGDSGTGKTTLVNIILGLLRPSSGEIIINNEFDYFETNIFDKMSYTPQDIFLVKGSILENIALGQSEEQINLQDLFDSTKNAQILSFLNEKDDFTDIKKILGEKNVENLSGGQAQRIAIARNLYFKKNINVFDEFTSALDVNAEDKIVEHLNKIKKNKIIIIVSHRMNAMKYCDSIYELNNGKLNKIKKT